MGWGGGGAPVTEKRSQGTKPAHSGRGLLKVLDIPLPGSLITTKKRPSASRCQWLHRAKMEVIVFRSNHRLMIFIVSKI